MRGGLYCSTKGVRLRGMINMEGSGWEGSREGGEPHLNYAFEYFLSVIYLSVSSYVVIIGSPQLGNDEFLSAEGVDVLLLPMLLPQQHDSRIKV